MGFFNNAAGILGGIGNIIGATGERSAAKDQNRRLDELRQQAQAPQTGPLGSTRTPTNVSLGAPHQDIADQIAARTAGANTTGMIPGIAEDTSNPNSRTQVGSMLAGEDRRSQERYINPALEQRALQQSRQGIGPSHSRFGAGTSGFADELARQYPQANTERNIRDIISEATDPSIIAALQGLLPQPLGFDTNLINATKPVPVPSTLSTLASIPTSLGATANTIDAGQQRDQSAERQQALIDELILQRQRGNQTNAPTGTPITDAALPLGFLRG